MLSWYKMITLHYSPITQCPIYWPDETADIDSEQTSSNLCSRDHISSSVCIWAWSDLLCLWNFFYWLQFIFRENFYSIMYTAQFKSICLPWVFKGFVETSETFSIHYDPWTQTTYLCEQKMMNWQIPITSLQGPSEGTRI